MKKFILTIAAMVILAVCVSGCGEVASTLIKSVEKSGSDYWKISYKKFNGYKEHEVELSGEGEHTFTVEIVTNSGTLGLTIKDDEGTSLYDGNELTSSSFEVKVNGEGKYIIRVDAVDHNGSFDIKWE